VQELDLSWQEHQKGISIPVVRNKVHPYYGTHIPSSYEHLVLFDNWLKRYDGPKKTAIDVGIGNGVLSFQLVKHGFQKAFGTDINPNAIFGLKAFMGETKLSRKIELDFGHLFGKWDKPTELIVFNPPWLPISKELERVDETVYYKENLFTEFFEAAKERLLPDGKIVLMFSNLSQLTAVEKEHPIEKELAEGGRFKLEKTLTKSVRASSDKTNRYRHLFIDEEVQLWILKHK
jgi:methylase of polypeptide subunit release factors